MKKSRWNFWVMSMLIASVGLLMSCSDDYNSDSGPTIKRKVYTLSQLASSGVSGTVTFLKQDNATLVTIQLTGTVSGDTHPAHIHGNSASEGGPIVLDLTSVDGATGKSETTVTQLNDGTPITYEQLVAFDGHVNVHKSVAEIAVMIAQGNIGSNATPVQDPNPNPNPYPYP